MGVVFLSSEDQTSSHSSFQSSGISGGLSQQIAFYDISKSVCMRSTCIDLTEIFLRNELRTRQLFHEVATPQVTQAYHQ